MVHAGQELWVGGIESAVAHEKFALMHSPLVSRFLDIDLGGELGADSQVGEGELAHTQAPRAVKAGAITGEFGPA